MHSKHRRKTRVSYFVYQFLIDHNNNKCFLVLIIYISLLCFFPKKQKEKDFKNASCPKFCNIIFLFLLEIGSVGPVDQQINFALPDMDDIYKNIKEYNSNKKREWKVLIVVDDMIADMLSNKKLNLIVVELFIRGRKLNIFLVFSKQSYFAIPKNITLNSTHYFGMKILNKRDVTQIAFSHSLDIDFEDFMNLYRKCTAKTYSFLGDWYYFCIR